MQVRHNLHPERIDAMSDYNNTGPTQDGCIPNIIGIFALGWLLCQWFGWL